MSGPNEPSCPRSGLPLATTPATPLQLPGVPAHVVAAQHGHADPAITLRVYAHAVNEQLAEAPTISAARIGGAA